MNITNTLKKPLLTILFLAFCQTIMAQQTGIFNQTINFNSESRTISFFVPADYDSTKTYNLIVGLHGLGDNSTNYLSALVNKNFYANMPNTILVCPDGGNDNLRSFEISEGDEQIIEESIKLATGLYKIDENKIILQGFSLGGRTTIRYGLNNTERFLGLLLSTPAIQGIKDAIAPIENGGINYANASKIPVYITYGNADFNYVAPIDTLYLKLIEHNSPVTLQVFNQMGHDIPSFGLIKNPFEYAENSANAPYDAGLVTFNIEPRTCLSEMPAKILLRNTGENNLTSAEIEYTINGNKNTYNFNGNLGSYEFALVIIPNLPANNGTNTLQAEIKTINGNITDTFAGNNSISTTFQKVDNGLSIPYSQNFDGATFPPQGWVLKQSGDYLLPWTRDTDIKKDGAAAMISLNTLFVFDTYNRREEILTPVIDLTTTSTPFLGFDVSYNFHKYTPPYFQDTVALADTLEIFISTDCGMNFTSIYKKGGTDLITFDEPIINPLSIPAAIIDPGPFDWRLEWLPLSSFGSATKAVVKFSYKSAQGGSIAIDNVRFTSTVGIEEKASLNTLKMFPNPATDIINITTGNEKVLQINVFDISGRNVLNIQNINSINSNLQINTSTLKNGLYIIDVQTDKSRSTGKIMIKK